MKKIIVLSSIVLYLVMLFGTYGYTVSRRDMTSLDAAVVGILWPLYWTCRGIGAIGNAAENVFKEQPYVPPKVER